MTAQMLRPSALAHRTCSRAFVASPKGPSKVLGRRSRCRADGDSNQGGDGLSERLKVAEAEAEALRKQLAAAKEAQGIKDEQPKEGASKRRGSRIDGAGLQRESPFAQGPGQWLSEANFVKGVNGPTESGGAASPEEAATVKKRLVIGGIATALVAALSLVPTDSLRISRPSKPLFFYLVPLVRVQSLLADLEQAAVDGKTDEVEAGIQRIQGAPNFAVENLRNAAAALPDSRAAEKAGVVARDVIEYLDSIDYNKYFESLLKSSARSGDSQKMFLDFSLNSIRAAKAKLKQFLALMPADQVEAATQQVKPIA